MAVDIGFYHCTRAPARDVAVTLAAKAYGQGQRLMIVAGGDHLQAIDKALWVRDPASFLPHGMAGAGDAAEQPILLGETPQAANGAALLMLVEHGLPAEFAPFTRVLNLFEDGSDGHARARLDWKAIAAREGVVRTYWKQGDGGWEKQG